MTIGAGDRAADAAAAGPKVKRGEAERTLRAALQKRTNAPVVAADCQVAGRGWRCRWRQAETVAGWAYECRGRAKLRRPRRWRIDPCRMAAATAPLRAPHDLIFGFNDDWGEHSNHLGYAEDIGTEVIRFPLGWNIVQPTAPLFSDWSYYDRLYRAAQQNGIRVVLSLQDAPCWSYDAPILCTEDTVGSQPDPAWLPSMQQFLKDAVSRYPEAIAVEVYNEPNLAPYWKGAPDPEYYAQLLAAGYDAVKAVRPDMPVLFGGLAPMRTSSETQMNFEEFFERALAAGARGKFDALSAHPYFRPFLADDYLGRVRDHLAKLKTVLYRHGIADVPLWITEIGVATAGEGAISESDQAERTAQLYGMARRIPGLNALLVHRMFDTRGTGTNEDGWGLVRSDLEVKPAYCAVAALNDRRPARCTS